jgi:hypothetical protein
VKSCECGCGQESGSDFAPGHDQRLRVALEKRVGGLLQLRALVESTESYVAGDLSEAAHLQAVRRLLSVTPKALMRGDA